MINRDARAYNMAVLVTKTSINDILLDFGDGLGIFKPTIEKNCSHLKEF